MRDHIYNDLGNICQGQDPKSMKVLEIGCGAGRVTVPLARYFGEIYAVDISRQMVRQARLATANYPNTHVFCNNGRDLTAVRSQWWRRLGIGRALDRFRILGDRVPAHSSRAIIENYVREVHRMLRPGGLFKFQVQGSPVEADPEHSWVGELVHGKAGPRHGGALWIRIAL